MAAAAILKNKNNARVYFKKAYYDEMLLFARFHFRLHGIFTAEAYIAMRLSVQLQL